MNRRLESPTKGRPNHSAGAFLHNTWMNESDSF